MLSDSTISTELREGRIDPRRGQVKEQVISCRRRQGGLSPSVLSQSLPPLRSSSSLSPLSLSLPLSLFNRSLPHTNPLFAEAAALFRLSVHHPTPAAQFFFLQQAGR